MPFSRVRSLSLSLILVLAATGSVFAGAHSWRVEELFSNADGTIQFVELAEYGGGCCETGVSSFAVISNALSAPIGGSFAPPTGFRSILFGTAAFAALPGAPPPDRIIPNGFFSVGGDGVRYSLEGPGIVFLPGQLPTDGVLSLGYGMVVAPNSPKNYAGVTGSVNAASGPAAIPDGSGLSSAMHGFKLAGAGTPISVTFDTTTCALSAQIEILYGEASHFPTGVLPSFGLAGSVCSIPGISPFTWNGTPTAADGRGLIWWVMTMRDGSGKEGSWGRQTGGAEEKGPGPGGSSGMCGVTSRDTGNACGH